MSLSFESIGTINSTISTHNKVDVLVEAKKDYTNQLKDILVGPMYNGFLTIYNDAKENCKKKRVLDQRLKKFQSYISKIPKWTDEELNMECERIVKLSKCDWLEYLITVVFVTHAKIRASIKDDHINYKNIQIDVPEKNNFIHKCYIESARKIWKNAYLYDDERISDSEYQRNIRDIESLLSEAIDITIRRSLPIRNLLEEYLGKDLKVINTSDEDITSMSAMNDKNIQNLIKKELEEIKTDLTNKETNTNGFATLVIDNSKIIEQPNKSNTPSTPSTPSTPKISASETNEPKISASETNEPKAELQNEIVSEPVEISKDTNIPIDVKPASPRQSPRQSPRPDIDRLNELMKDTERKISKHGEVDIDIISVSDMPKINKNSNSIKQQLNDSQNYSIASSRRQKKYSTFLLRS